MTNAPHMTLDDWMAENAATLESFGRVVKASPATVSRWRSGESFPRRDALARIYVATGGKVTASSFAMQIPASKAAS